MKKKGLRIAAFVTALILLGGIGWFANALVGNPISKALSRKNAGRYIAGHYADQGYEIQRVYYSFKDGGYHAAVSSPAVLDGDFTISCNGLGKVVSDSYEFDVTEKYNTVRRLDNAYRELMDQALKNPGFPYSSDIAFGELYMAPREGILSEESGLPKYAIPYEELELNGVYDIRQLGKRAGNLVIYVENQDITLENAAECMLKIRAFLDQAGIPFRSMSFTLYQPREEDKPRSDVQISVERFDYEEIYAEGMVERVKKAHEELEAYYKEMDSIKK